MNLSSSIRSGLFLTSACAVLAACSGSGEVQNGGNTGTVVVNPGGGGGTGGGVTTLDFTVSACPAAANEVTRTVSGTQITACEITGTVLGNVTLGGGNVYILNGSVQVGENLISNPAGQTGTLTIEPGTVLVANTTDDTVDILIVSPGSRLVADGNPNEPIVFSTLEDLLDATAGGSAQALAAVSDGVVSGAAAVSDNTKRFGGLVINGLAPINNCPGFTGGAADCNSEGEGGSGLYGGNQPADNSGILRYVRVQYAGFPFTPTNELNGIALQGVGSGTLVDNVHIHNNADDGIEFFGGTVNASHVVVTDAGDDSLDFTFGWTGNLQYALVFGGGSNNDNGLEGDNNGDNGFDLLPRTNPTISNLTLIGNGAPGSVGGDDGFALRAGVSGIVANSIVTLFRDAGIDFDQNSAQGATPDLFSIFVAENGELGEDGGPALFGASGTNVSGNVNTLNGIFSGAAEQAVAATDVSNSFVEQVDFVGAFEDNVQTVASSWLAGWALTSVLPGDVGVNACPAGTTLSSRPVPAGRTEARVCDLPSEVLSDTNLTAGNLYELDGSTFIGTDAGGDAANPAAGSVSVTLSIDPGVTIFANSGNDLVDTLIVTRGSRIVANGTRTSPIIMTNLNDVTGVSPQVDPADPTSRWGGLVISGRAPINNCPGFTGGTADCESEGEGGSGLYGGNSETDDSGVLNFVQVRFAGFPFTPTNELNGIAMQGVGSGTFVDFIQVESNADDGIEFFGGTVNAKHVVITNAEDDSIDWTFGWRGNLQYAIVVGAPSTNDNIFEGDNNGDNGFDLAPRSNPTIANFTGIGNRAGSVGQDDGIVLRAGVNATLANGIIVGVRDAGIDFDQNSAEGVVPTLFSTYLAGNGELEEDSGDLVFNSTATNVSGTDGVLVADSDGTTAALLPNAEILSSVTPTAIDEDGDAGTPNEFFDDADYVGAVDGDSDNWYVGWTFGL